MLRFVLFGNERRDVGFESSDADAENDKTNGKGSNGAMRMGNDRGYGRDDENYVADDGNEDGNLDSLVSPPVLVGHVCAY